MAVGLLLAYTDADADEPREVVFQWYDWQNRAMRARTTRYDAFAPYIACNHVLYANSPRFELKKGNKAWSLRDGVETGTPAETREEAFSHLWDAQPEGLLHLGTPCAAANHGLRLAFRHLQDEVAAAFLVAQFGIPDRGNAPAVKAVAHFDLLIAPV